MMPNQRNYAHIHRVINLANNTVIKTLPPNIYFEREIDPRLPVKQSYRSNKMVKYFMSNWKF